MADAAAAPVPAVAPARAAWLDQSPPESFFTLDDVGRRAKEDDPVDNEFFVRLLPLCFFWSARNGVGVSTRGCSSNNHTLAY
jgi:hypothetical protein